MKHCLGVTLFLLAFLCVTAQDYKVGSKVQSKWGGYWRKGTVVEIKKNKYKVHYDGYGVGYDQWVTAEEFRVTGDKPVAINTAATQPATTPADKPAPPVAADSNATTPVSKETVVKEKKTYSQRRAEEKKIQDQKAAEKKALQQAAAEQKVAAAPDKKDIRTAEKQKEIPPSPKSEITGIKVSTVEKNGSPSSTTTKTSTVPSAPAIRPTMVGEKAYLRASASNTFIFYLGKENVIVRNAKFGINPVDLEKEKQYNAANVGVWSIAGERMRVDWHDGSKSDWKVAFSPAAIYGLDGSSVSLVKNMPPGYILNGKFAANTTTTSQDINFHTDGTFDASEGTGKYAISGNTLTLTFNNGQTAKSLICLTNASGKKFIIINNTSYSIL